MKTLTLDLDTPSQSEVILQQITDGLYDLNPPDDALYAQLYQALVDEHQNAIDLKEQEMVDLLRSVMINAHLILTLAYPDKHTPNPPGAGSPQTIRALIHQQALLEKKNE